MTRQAHRIGAFCYALWGLLHVWAGSDPMRAGGREQLTMLSTAELPVAELPADLAPVVEATIRFHGRQTSAAWSGPRVSKSSTRRGSRPKSASRSPPLGSPRVGPFF